MSNIGELIQRIIDGEECTREEAMELYAHPLGELSDGANRIRSHFCSNGFDICTIINARSGRCTENCKFCAQSSYNHAHIQEYPLMAAEEIILHSGQNAQRGVVRYSIVTSGRGMSDGEIDRMCETIRGIREKSGISVCVSFGLLNETQYKKLKDAGVTRIHNNLETSGRNFPNICTTHTYDDKIAAIRSAQAAGLSVCSGGIMGIGETVEDRIDMAFTLRELGIKSVPLNMLNPIFGTPLEKNQKLTEEDMCRISAVYRFILPTSSIRLAGGRGLLRDRGESCFLSGANAAISGDMLTTAGITVETDMDMIKKLGYEVKLCNE